MPAHGKKGAPYQRSTIDPAMRADGDDKVWAVVREKFLDQMFSPKKHTSFFMGNFEDPKKRHNFSVLGVYYPDRRVAAEATLFD